ncbi:MAG: methionyl-tRNA formyltransferase [Chitinophagales bacterium]|nr:methionyl-tRNA formyltransferase [Chitinophagales bacterium]
MKIVFMGTPEFAVPSLSILVESGYEVVAVVTAQDSYGGRGGKQLLQSAVKQYAVAQGLLVLQPEKLRAPEFIKKLASLQADVFIVVAFRMLPEIVWNMPPLGTFNLHGSLLPKYRGAAPINHAIMQGETITGVTSFRLSHEIDTGDILLKAELPIEPDDTAGTLHDKMKELGAQVILKTVKTLESGTYEFILQDHSTATPAPKIFHHTCQIDFNQPVQEVYNFVRGLSPYPTAWCVIDDTEIKIIQASWHHDVDSLQPGTIVTDQKKNLRIKCQNGYLSLEKVKPASKKVLTTNEYLNGHQIENLKVIRLETAM